MKFYPLKLAPVLKSAIWGGKSIPETFGIGEKGQSVAEAWMMTDREDGVNLIENGAYTGLSLDEYIKQVGSENVYGEGTFPLLIKIIDAADKLSVQVHPDNAYAASHGLDAGKTEMWYVLSAKEGASLVSGLREGVTPQALKESALDGTCENNLNYVPVKKGDCFYIPAGLVHAIGEGILIAEIQQNSNTTYRLYDYDRVGADGKKREIHIDKAAEVVKTQFDMSGVTVGKEVYDKNGIKTAILCKCDYFSVMRMNLEKNVSAAFAEKGNMKHLLFTEGSGYLRCGDARYPFIKGNSYLLPKACPTVEVFAEEDAEVIVSC